MSTARIIITDATKLLGVWQKGESLDSDEAADGLRYLNNMIAGWNNNYLMLNQRVQRTLALTSGDASYTIGSSGDIDVTRPIQIETAYIRDSNNVDTPLSILNNEQWSSITMKSTSSNVPVYLNYRANYPLGVISLHEAPSSGLTLILECWDQLPSFTTLDTAASLPPGYERALTYNLAVELAPMYGTEASPTIKEIATRSMGGIMDANNTEVPVLNSPLAPYRANYLFGGI